TLLLERDTEVEAAVRVDAEARAVRDTPRRDVALIVTFERRRVCLLGVEIELCARERARQLLVVVERRDVEARRPAVVKDQAGVRVKAGPPLLVVLAIAVPVPAFE